MENAKARADWTWEHGKKLSFIKASQDTYHFEYLALHNQRMALVNLMERWCQLGFASSAVAFGVFVGISLRNNQLDISLLWLGFTVALLILWACVAYGTAFDYRDPGGIQSLYPRIVTIEQMLDFRFFRDRLRYDRNYGTAVAESERIDSSEHSGDLSLRIREKFRTARGHAPKNLWQLHTEGRGFKGLMRGAWTITIAYLIVALYLTFWHG